MPWNHFDYTERLLWLCFGEGCHNILTSLDSHGPAEDGCCVLSFPAFRIEMVIQRSKLTCPPSVKYLLFLKPLFQLCLLHANSSALWLSVFRSWFLSIHVWEYLLLYWRKELGKFFYPLEQVHSDPVKTMSNQFRCFKYMFILTLCSYVCTWKCTSSLYTNRARTFHNTLVCWHIACIFMTLDEEKQCNFIEK